MTISSRQDLIDYALRKLGAPVLAIEVDNNQVEDRVDEALQFFQDFHYDGTERVYLKHQIVGTVINVTSGADFIVGEHVRATSGATFQIAGISGDKLITKAVFLSGVPGYNFSSLETITGVSSGASTTVISKVVGDIENGWVPISDMVTGIIRAIPWWHVTNKTSYIFDPQYQVILSSFQSLSSSSMIYFSQLMSHISMLDQILRPIDSVRFNQKMNRVSLDFDWTTAEIGGFLIFECFRILDPETFIEVYSDRMLKKLVTAKIKYQWATNLQKYQGIQLLGGVTVDASTLMAQAVAEIESAENEIRTSYSESPIGFIG